MELVADPVGEWQPEAEGLAEVERDCVRLPEREGDVEKEGEADAELDAERDCVTDP